LADTYLSPTGEIWFFENGEASSELLLVPYIDQNPGLEYVESVRDGRDPMFSWMISRLRRQVAD